MGFGKLGEALQTQKYKRPRYSRPWKAKSSHGTQNVVTMAQASNITVGTNVETKLCPEYTIRTVNQIQ
jgi:hypothetical protein